MKVSFEFYRGDTYERTFALLWSKEITNVYFTVKQTSDNKRPIIQKKLGDGINLVDVTEDGNVYLLTIDSEDTEKLLSNNAYNFDIEVLSNNLRQTPIVGTINLKEDYTRRKDEK